MEIVLWLSKKAVTESLAIHNYRLDPAHMSEEELSDARSRHEELLTSNEKKMKVFGSKGE